MTARDRFKFLTIGSRKRSLLSSTLLNPPKEVPPYQAGIPQGRSSSQYLTHLGTDSYFKIFRCMVSDYSVHEMTVYMECRNYLKNADYVQGQGAGRRKSGAYTVVCEHFEEVRNAVIER